MDLKSRLAGIFGKKKKELRRREEAAAGVRIEEITGDEKAYREHSLYVCNAVINFFVVFGSIGCVMGSLGMKWNPVLLTMLLFPAAVGMSYFYRNRWFRLAGYTVIVGGILLSLQQFLLFLRSGFALISNRLMQLVEKQLELPMEREYEVYVENHDLAVVMCLLLIGMVMELFFNIIVSEMKNYWIVLLFSFPFIQLPIYLNQRLPVFYFILYCAGVIAMYAIRSSGHYGIPLRKQPDYMSRKLGKKNYILYRFDGASNLAVTFAIVLMAVVVAGVLWMAYPVGKFEARHTVQSAWKEKTRSFARRFALVGFWGMLSDNEDGAGGVGTGRLGSLNRVRMDFEPDFYIYTTKSDGERTLYLRSFCGSTYGNNAWSIETDRGEQGFCVHFQPADEFLYLDSVDTKVLSVTTKEAVLENKGAGTRYVYVPYWNRTDAKNYFDGKGRRTESRLAVGNRAKLVYQAITEELSVAKLKERISEIEKKQNGELWKTFLAYESAYRKTVYNAYLQVEEGQKERLLSLCRQNGIFPEDADAVEKVCDFLQENYTYTLMPGITPKGEDFVDYFLFEQKKGYCVYFASAATLMFRSLGIPARYVCGYAAFADVFRDAAETDAEEIAEWTGAAEDELYRLELTDANAHAWVEIYVDGFGWLPVEVTTAQAVEEEPEEEVSNFLGIQQFIAGLFSAETVAAVRNTTIWVFVVLVTAVLLVLAAFPVVCMLVRKKRRAKFLTEDTGTAVCFMFAYLNRLAKAAGFKEKKGSNYRQRGEEMSCFFGFAETDMQELVRLMEQARFSSKPLTKEEQTAYFEKTKEFSEGMLLRMKQPKRLLLGGFYRF